MTKREKLAFIAGFFEGEGCIQITKQKTYPTLRVTIGNTDLGLLEFIKNNLRMGRICSRRPGKKSNFKVYGYLVTGPKAFVVLKKLLPFLKSKKEEAILGIKFQEQKSKGKGLYGGHCPIPKEIKVEREKVYWKMKALKSVRKIRIKGGELKN